MKTVDELFAELRHRKVKLWSEGENLRYRANKEALTPDLLEELRERKTEILMFLHQADAATGSNPPPILPTPRDGNLPLSFAQSRLWFLDQLEPNSSAYNMPVTYRLTGFLNIAALQQSLSEIVRRHEVLRTTFPSQDGQPKLVLTPHIHLMLPVVDLEKFPETERKAIAQRLATEKAQQPFDLATGPLFRFKLLRLAAAEHVLLLTIHHIVFDGWSYAILFQELAALYEALSADKPSPLPELVIQYADFANWQRQWLQGEVLESQLSYWKQQLSGHIPILQLPTDHPRPPVQAYRGAYQTSSLPPDLSKALKALSQYESATLFMTLLAAFKILLYRYSGQTNIIVGTPTAGRNRKETEQLIGFFVNSLVLRTDFEGNPSFRELLGWVREVALGAYTHQDLPFEKLVEELQPERNLSPTPLFQVWFNMVNLADTKLELPGLLVERLEIQQTPSKFDLTLYIQEKSHGIELELVYNAELFAPARMVEMLAQFQHLLQQIVEFPDKNIADFSLLTSKAELLLPNPYQALVSTWEDAVHTRFSHQARLVPQNLAVANAQVAWSYAELEQRANQLANYLLGNGIGSQDIVAIYGHRSVSLIWAVLGVLKAGAAFVILDPAYPVAHLIDRLCIAKPRGWLQLETDSSLPAELEEFVRALSCCSLQLPQRSINLAGNLLTGYSTNDPAVVVDPDNLAYLTFTSGTTGKPKGILGTHRPLSHFLQWHCQTFDLNQSDRFSLLSGLSHDPLLRDIFTPLWLGATLCIPEPEDIETPGRLVQWMGQQKVSITHVTPAMGQLLTESKLATSDISSLRYVFFGGDLLTKGDVAKIRKLAPTSTCVNFYGTTETPQAMGYFIISNYSKRNQDSSSESLKASIPLGRGIEDVQLLILNNAQQLAGIGEVGEIYIRTPYLAKGYIADEELTQERFILNPFTKTIGDRLYKTGDLARYLPDGNIEFLGRLDYQIKLRGFRIELGEIEAAIAQHPSVQQTVVTAREDNPGDRRLVAYIVSISEQTLTTDELRRFLKQKLPGYMVPSTFVFLDILPLTPNGKIDRRALPAPDQLRQEPEETFLAPRDELELQLATIWEQVLGKKPIGLRDSFFDLGGNSLVSVRLFAQIEKTFGKNLPLAILFQAPTIEQLASIVRAQGWLVPESSLVSIQVGGFNPPFFFINSISYAKIFGAYLGSEQPFYCLNIFGLTGLFEKQLSSLKIQDIAEQFIKDMRTIQPNGPYLLGAYCADSFLAFEMAQQLNAQGQKVALLAFIDAIWSPQNLEMYFHWSNLRQFGYKYVLQKMKNKLRYIKEKLIIRLKRIRGKFYSQTGQTLPCNLQDVNLLKAFYQATDTYLPQVYPGQITLFLSSEWQFKNSPKLQELAAGGLEIQEIPGYHHSLFEEPQVLALAEKLKACIDKTQAIERSML